MAAHDTTNVVVSHLWSKALKKSSEVGDIQFYKYELCHEFYMRFSTKGTEQIHY